MSEKQKRKIQVGDRCVVTCEDGAEFWEFGSEGVIVEVRGAGVVYVDFDEIVDTYLGSVWPINGCDIKLVVDDEEKSDGVDEVDAEEVKESEDDESEK